jgi:hypothetical protein
MEDNLTEHQKILLEIVDGIDAYVKEHEHQQVRDPCKGIYIPSNLVKRLIKVRLPRLADKNNPVPNSKELTLLAETDWHNREERKHQYEMIPWTMGWMTGFLSERKPHWPKVHEAAIRKDEREKVLAGLKQGRKVITLCGSVKFWDEYVRQNAILTLQGNIVFSCGLSLKAGYEDLICDLPLDDVKADLDFIHLRKIDLSDEIFVLNVGGYIGDSTKREIEYALSKGKVIRYLESPCNTTTVQELPHGP